MRPFFLLLVSAFCVGLPCPAQSGLPEASAMSAAHFAPQGAGIGGVSSMSGPSALFDSREGFALLQFKDTRLAIDQPGVGPNNFYSMLVNCQRTTLVGPT